jgi:hydroxymethylpyrimidine/phosphomethylpyrimidine kinase
MGTDAVKTGMLFNGEIVELVASKIKKYDWSQIVVDPVMIAKGGAALLQQEAVEAMRRYLLPAATIITPNIPEAEELSGMKINDVEDMKAAAQILVEYGTKNVIIKGGHGSEDKLTDLLFDGHKFTELESKRLSTKNTHGTGCTFAAAVAASLAKGKSMEEAFQTGKEFVYYAIQKDLHIGNGHGPTNHWAYQECKK